MKRVRQIDELTAHAGTADWRLLSGDNGELAIQPLMREKVALVSGVNRECLLLVAPGCYPSQAYFEAARHAHRLEYTVKPLYAEQSILTLLHDQQAALATTDAADRLITQEDRERLDELITEAVTRGAADIMISPRKGSQTQYLAELDIDTMITPYRDYTRDEIEGMMQCFYQSKADQETVEEPIFKFGSAQFAAGDGVWAGHRTRIRYQSKPAFPGGTDFALRLLMMSETSGFNSIHDLNLPLQQARMLERASRRDSGAIVLAGQTSSGKTTSVKVMLENLSRTRPDIVIRSLESPPEYVMRGVHQHAVRESKGGELQALSEHVKELMRMNPTYLFLGEVRGHESAGLFLHMLESGHGVILTGHAGSPLGIYSKLEGLGISKQVMTQASNVNALIFQRRLPRLCPHCKIPMSQSAAVEDKEAFDRLRMLKASLERVCVQNPEGCSQCNNRGIRGTRVAMDVVRPDLRMSEAVRADDTREFHARWVELCVEHNWGDAAETALYHSLRLVLEGEVSIHTVESRFSEIDSTLLTDECRTWKTSGGFACEFSV